MYLGSIVWFISFVPNLHQQASDSNCIRHKELFKGSKTCSKIHLHGQLELRFS